VTGTTFAKENGALHLHTPPKSAIECKRDFRGTHTRCVIIQFPSRPLRTPDPENSVAVALTIFRSFSRPGRDAPTFFLKRHPKLTAIERNAAFEVAHHCLRVLANDIIEDLNEKDGAA